MTADTMSVPTPRIVHPTRPVRSTRPARLDGVGRTTEVRRLPDALRSSRPFHAEHDAAPVWMRVLGAALAVGGAGLTAAVLGWPGEAPEAALIVPGIVGLVVGLLLLTARSGMTISDTHVTLHFRPLPPRRIARHRIVDARLVEADGSTYGGIGLRLGRGVRALLLTPGLGIEFRDDRGRITFVRTRRPEDAFRALAGRHRAADSTEQRQTGE